MEQKNLTTSYKQYLEEVQHPVDKETYLQITKDYNKFLTNKVIEGDEVTLPSRMGVLSIIGKKCLIKMNGDYKGLSPDWVKTKKLWDSNPEAKKKKQLLFHINPHTDNVRYKWFWSRRNILVEHKYLYKLIMSRANKRAIWNAIKQGKRYKTSDAKDIKH